MERINLREYLLKERKNNMKKESYGINHMVGDVFYTEFIGHDLVKSILLLLKENKKEGGSGIYFNTINLLASQALELLPKSLIATSIFLNKKSDSPEKIYRAINKKLSCLNHDLDDIFDEAPELKKVLDIIKIERVNKKTKNNKDIYIDEFRFTLKNNEIIRIKNLEGARYGLLAKNVDIGGNSIHDIKQISDFLNKLSVETGKIRAEIINRFDKK